jgi:glycosyltransferase involved in cell wall biosynthesis
MAPSLVSGKRAVVLAEEWQTVHAVQHLDYLLRLDDLRDRVTMFWNANNTFGFDPIDWSRLSAAAFVTTVSRYMRQRMHAWAVDPIVIPNGLSDDAFQQPDREAVGELRRKIPNRIILTKMARWDPDKRWIGSVEIVAELKRQGWSPLLIARGGNEPHGGEVMQAARDAGLRVVERSNDNGGVKGMLEALDGVEDYDIVSLRSHVDPDSRRVLFSGSDAVLANSSHEPFGLVGLEAMAVGGIACTGCSGEDYAVSCRNGLVLQTGDSQEFIGLYRWLQERPERVSGLRRAARRTAQEYAWPEIIRRELMPRVELAGAAQLTASVEVQTEDTEVSTPEEEPAPRERSSQTHTGRRSKKSGERRRGRSRRRPRQRPAAPETA